jgi:hypothetical protein
MIFCYQFMAQKYIFMPSKLYFFEKNQIFIFSAHVTEINIQIWSNESFYKNIFKKLKKIPFFFIFFVQDEADFLEKNCTFLKKIEFLCFPHMLQK